MQIPNAQPVTPVNRQHNGAIRYPQKPGHNILRNGETNEIMSANIQPTWLYDLNWQNLPQLLPPQPLATPPEHWLILADRSGYGTGMARYLSQTGQRVTLAFADDNRFEIGEQSICLAPANKQHWHQLLDQIEFPTRILHFWSLEIAPLDLSDHPLGWASLVALLQVLVKRNADLTQVWLFTQMAQAVTPKQPTLSLSQAPLWGLARTIAWEMPQLWGGIIDLDSQTSPTETAPLIAACLAHPAAEKQLALRHGQLYAARWQQIRSLEPVRGDLNLRDDGTYLISGGLGALGLHLAHWLAEHGAKQLLLLNRTGLPPRNLWPTLADDDPIGPKVQAIQRLESRGVTVHLGQVDVADLAQLASFLGQFATADAPPIRGIIHAAGVLQPHSITALSAATWRETLAPKVNGSWHLHTLLQNQPLDFFILFSSISATLGAANLAAYAAGNAFLDGLAHYRQHLGLPALAINWGPWANTGMAAEQAAVFKAYGLEPLSMAQNLATLNYLWQQPHAQVGVMATTAQFSGNGDEPVLSDNQADHLAEAELNRYLTECLQALLPHSNRQWAADDNLLEWGFDSITAMALTHRLSQDFGRQFYPQEILARPVLHHLAQYLAAQLPETKPRPASNRSPLIRSVSPARPHLKKIATPNPSAIFILSAPRSGSTLLRAMLAGHTDLFCPPELNLLPFANLTERADALGPHQLDQGLPRALMTLLNLDAAQSQAVVQGWQQAQIPVQIVYRRLQALAAPATLVDKSPLNSLQMANLERAEMLFDQPKYIHLVRHPQAVIQSFVDNRFAQIFGLTADNPNLAAEQLWQTANQTIRRFAASLTPNRYYLLDYETLVTDPEATMHGLCQFLEIDDQAALLNPYESGGDDPRMLTGLHPETTGIGDPNFLKHDGIEAALAQQGAAIDRPWPLQALTSQLAADFGYASPAPLIEPTPAALSFAQQRLWIVEQMSEGQMRYHIPAGFFRITGELNQPALLKALQQIVDRHEALRTTIAVVDGLPHPVVQPSTQLDVRLIDLSLESNPEQASQVAATHWFEQPFSLMQEPPLRIQLARLREKRHDLHLVLHHLAADGWSLMIIFHELRQLYQAACQQTADPLPPLACAYTTYVNQQRLWLDSPAADQQRDYWLTELKDAPAMLKIPIDMPRAASSTYQGGVSHLTLPDALSSRLPGFASQHQATPFSVVLTALATTLYHWAKQSDMVIGTVATGRTDPEAANLVGCFMNFLPLRLSVQPTMRGLDLLTLVATKTRQMQANQDYPFEKIAELGQQPRNRQQNPFYNVVFIWQKFSQFSALSADVKVDFIPLNTATAHLDLRLVLYELADKLLLRCEFRRDLFLSKTIDDLLANIAQNLATLLSVPDRPLDPTATKPGLNEPLPEVSDVGARANIKIAANFEATPLADSLHFWRQSLDLAYDFAFVSPAATLVDMLDQVVAQQTDQPIVLLVQPNAGQSQLAVTFIDQLRAMAENTGSRYLLIFGPSRQPTDFERQVIAALNPTNQLKIMPSTVWDKRHAPCSFEGETYTPAFYATLGTKIVEQLIDWEAT